MALVSLRDKGLELVLKIFLFAKQIPMFVIKNVNFDKLQKVEINSLLEIVILSDLFQKLYVYDCLYQLTCLQNHSKWTY